MKTKPGSEAFTLVELLVVIAVIGLMALLVVPGVQSGIRAAEVSQSMHRMKTLYKGIVDFAAENKGRLPGGGYDGSRSSTGQQRPLVRWMHLVAPYVGVEANGSFEGVAYSTLGYSPELDYLFTDPAITGKPKKNDQPGTYYARYGFNLELVTDQSMTGPVITAIPDPAQTVLLATKAQQAPGLRPTPYPQHGFGIAAAWRKDRNPELGFPGRAGILFCDGHLETVEELPERELYLLYK